MDSYGAAVHLCPRRSLCALPHPPRCGLRGGYFELQGFDAEVVAQMLKLRSISLCSNVVGQFATGLMVRRLVRHLVESLVRHMVPARHGPTLGPSLAVEQVRPPEARGPSHATYAAERSAILTSLERRAVRIAET